TKIQCKRILHPLWRAIRSTYDYLRTHKSPARVTKTPAEQTTEGSTRCGQAARSLGFRDQPYFAAQLLHEHAHQQLRKDQFHDTIATVAHIRSRRTQRFLCPMNWHR